MKNLIRISGVILIIFLIHSCKKDSSLTIITSEVTEISFTTATSGGNITNDGGVIVITCGVCWNTSTNPTIENSKTTSSTGTGVFVSLITGLTVGKKYYVRAYATNSKGTVYGNEMSFRTLSIGSAYQGGIIAYILEPGDPFYKAGETHGLIAAPWDQSNGIEWNNGSNTLTGVTNTQFGIGNANTNNIVALLGEGSYAAKICYDLAIEGYSDWYLPSKDELHKLYLYRASIGHFTSNYYWSSRESSLSNAWCQDFYTGTQYSNKLKGNQANVRAIRNF